jgi:hypothetical protein
MLAPAIADPGTKAYFTNLSPQKRIGTVADLGDAVALISSESARWISGQSIIVAVSFALQHCIRLSGSLSPSVSLSLSLFPFLHTHTDSPCCMYVHRAERSN